MTTTDPPFNSKAASPSRKKYLEKTHTVRLEGWVGFFLEQINIAQKCCESF
jgi:hypothetical protein